MTNLTAVFDALVRLFFALLTAFALPRVLSLINAKLDAEQRRRLSDAAAVAVGAAEQLYNSSQAREKKHYVLALLHEQGFDVDFDAVDAAIEAEVLRLHAAIRREAAP